MTSDAKSLSALAAQLIVEGSLDVIAGKPGAQFPVPGGLRLSDARRAELGRPPGGSTLYYAVGESDGPRGDNGVFVDFQEATTTVWFHGEDSANAMSQLEKALKRNYPKAVKQKDKPHKTERDSRYRSYDVPLGDGRAAVLDVAYPTSKARAKRFAVRILAFSKGNQGH